MQENTKSYTYSVNVFIYSLYKSSKKYKNVYNCQITRTT